MTACDTGGQGLRKEGPAKSESVKRATPTPESAATPSPSGSPSAAEVDAVALLKADPKVSAHIKRALAKPCQGEDYPVDVSYGDLTGGTADDLVVNVLTCADDIGAGSYAYRRQAGRYRNVFTSEQAPVYAEINRGELLVTQQVYGEGDPVCCPSGEDVILYRWADHAFAEQSRTHTDYSKSGDGSLPSDGDNGTVEDNGDTDSTDSTED
ncbi:hypothetical protein QMK28_11190 [Streptomyces sp. H27-D2]|nr:hypothetical protein [Streptomyces sp. H27-D2]MEC4016861.1 hypothetical protein [Streptomyces sp. H27-D2]